MFIFSALAHRRDGEESEPGIGLVRRLYYYVVSFAALMVSANGVVLLIGYLVDNLNGEATVSPSSQELALGLALSLVGAPIWLLFWTMAQRSIERHPSERRSPVRSLYVFVILGVSLGLMGAGLLSLLRVLLGAADLEGSHVALPVVWGGLWAYHWYLQSKEDQPGEIALVLREVYVYVASLASSVMLLGGAGLVLEELLLAAYEAIAFQPSPINVDLWSYLVRTSLAAGIVGALGWWWHWHRASRDHLESILRQVYLYLFGILGGTATVAVSMSVLVYHVLQWAMGAPGLSSTGQHFSMMPGAMVAILIGAALWGYHWAVLQREAKMASDKAASARRIYRYLVASLGLGTLAASLVFLVALAVALVAPEARDAPAPGGWWKDELALVITLLLVGAPLWGYLWYRAQADACGSPEERQSTTRKVFIYGVFGVAVLATLGSLSSVLFFLLEGLLEDEFTGAVFQDAKWGLGVLIAAGAVSVYYWLVLREDRRVLASFEVQAPTARVRKSVILLVPEGASAVVRRLESELSYGVRHWQTMESEAIPSVSQEAIRALAENIRQSASDRLMVTMDADGVRVVPYREA